MVFLDLYQNQKLSSGIRKSSNESINHRLNSSQILTSNVFHKLHFQVLSVAMAHRVGIVKASEDIVAIHVGSAHRKPAFKACEWLIDELKKQAPLWKKEVTDKGVQWKAGLG